ncbi:MAG: ArnT family glycosyltransferase [Planctomycetota bacterium]|jgi:4-amino-4-deoxy-L-arabinose transferase-like glycosyltransferase
MPGRKLFASTGSKVGALLALLLSVLAAMHLLQPEEGGSRSLEFAYAIWLALAFFGLQLGIGRSILELPVFTPLRGPGSAFVAISLGTFLSTWILALLGVLGSLDRNGLFVYLVLGLFLSLRSCWQAMRGGGEEVSEERSGFIAEHPRLFGLGVIAFLLPFVLQVLLPDSDWDAAQYHLPMASAFLEQGILASDFALNAQFRPGNAQLLYAGFMLLGGEVAIQVLNLFAVLVACGLIYQLGARVFSRAAGAWALGISLSCNILLELGLDARVEPFLIWFFVAGCLGLFTWWRAPDHRGWLLVCAAMAGMAAGCKYNGLLYATLLMVPAGLRLLMLRTPMQVKGLFALAALLLLLFPSGTWYARNFMHTGDPAYPLLYGPMNQDRNGELRRFGTELDRPAKAVRPPTRIDERIETLAGKRMESLPASNFLLPFAAQLAPEEYADKPYHSLSPFLLLFLLLPIFDRRRRSLWLFAFLIAGYLLASGMTPRSRYWAPLFPLFALGAGLVLAKAERSWLRALLLLPLLGLLGFNAYREYAKLFELGADRYLTDKESEIEFLQRVGYNQADKAMPKVIGIINGAVAAGTIQPDWSVFMIGEGKGHLLDCRYRPSISAGGKEWIVELYNAGWEYEQLAQNLRARNIRYLLINQGWLDWNLQNLQVGKRRMTVTLHTLNQFLEEYAILESEADLGTMKLYRLRDPGD